MRIGYTRLPPSGACKGRAPRTALRRDFRCLSRALEWSSARRLLYFRVPPSLLPAGGDIESWLPWKNELEALGTFIRARGIRLAVRPGSGTHLSTSDDDQFRHSASLLLRLARLLDAMNLDATHKIQVAGEPEVCEPRPNGSEADLLRFDERHRRLAEPVQRRLAVETPNRRFALRDSLRLWSLTGIPIVHRTSFVSVQTIDAALARCRRTWAEDDGSPMVDLHPPAAPSVDQLLANPPGADYMVETGTLPEGLFKSET